MGNTPLLLANALIMLPQTSVRSQGLVSAFSRTGFPRFINRKYFPEDASRIGSMLQRSSIDCGYVGNSHRRSPERVADAGSSHRHSPFDHLPHFPGEKCSPKLASCVEAPFGVVRSGASNAGSGRPHSPASCRDVGSTRRRSPERVADAGNGYRCSPVRWFQHRKRLLENAFDYGKRAPASFRTRHCRDLRKMMRTQISCAKESC